MATAYGNPSVAAAETELLTTADGTPLKVSLRRALRRQKLISVGLVLPLLLFIGFSFIMPIATMLFRSVDNAVVPEVMERTYQVIGTWDGEGTPPERVYEAWVRDMIAGDETKEVGSVAARLNYERSGVRGLIYKTLRQLRDLPASVESYKQTLIEIDDEWADPALWKIIQRESGYYTDAYYLAALDMQRDADGEIAMQPDWRQIYVDLFIRTLWVSLLITGLTLLLGYPVSYLLANLPLRISNLLMIMVLLPFWTSLLVRTTTWIALLQQQGVLNDLMVAIGILSDDGRLQMIYNMTGTVVAMTHILLPFMILPLYSVMKTIPPSYVRAARSLGATPWTAFWKIYFPQTLPGIGAGGILVFILAIGYYITPALVGGQDGTLISNQIAHHMQKSLNWGLAAALGTLLLGAVLILYWTYNKIIGVENMKLG